MYGRNAFAFTIDNSANVSLGNASKTSFDAGELAASQSTTTFDLYREVRTPWHAPLRVALGGEFRADRYEITAGDPDSYRDGGVQGARCQRQCRRRDSRRSARRSFLAFVRPTPASHAAPTCAAYVDLESDLTSSFLLGVAGRVERYSDFGSTSTGQGRGAVRAVTRDSRCAARRAPASARRRSARSSSRRRRRTSSPACPSTSARFPVSTPEARVLGARDLEPERSVNLSAGIAVEPARGLAITADFYRITIDKRIVLSDNFTGTAVQALFTKCRPRRRERRPLLLERHRHAFERRRPRRELRRELRRAAACCG